MSDPHFNPDDEVFKPIPDFPGYEASTHGRIRSFYRRSGKGKGGGKGAEWILENTPQSIREPNLSRTGYPFLVLVKDQKHYTRTVHRLVLETFVGPKPFGGCCRHLDGVRTHNYLANLTWGTYSENTFDRIKHGNMTSQTGEGNRSAKLTDAKVLEIRKLAAQGLPQKVLVEMFNSSTGNINNVIHRRTWRHLKAEKPNQMP